MGALLSMLASGLPAIIGAILAFITRKLGTAAGSIVAFVALTVAFIACNQSIFAELTALINPPAAIANALGMFIPPDFGLCLSSWLSAKICRTAYEMAQEKLRFINNAS